MADTFKQWCLPQVNVTVAAGRTRQVHGYRSLACLVAQWCLALRDPMNCGPPGSSVQGIPQARILEWVAISSSRGSSQPRD